MAPCGTDRKGSTELRSCRRATTPELRRVGLPGDPDDTHSRYIEAEAKGFIVGSLYLPNGNPVGTEKFDYKLRWIERLCAHAARTARGRAARGAVRRLERGARGSRRFLGPGDRRTTL